jgi:hypothetical protein
MTVSLTGLARRSPVEWSTRQVASGPANRRRCGSGEQLALGEWAALLDLDPTLAAVVGVVGADLVGKVLDDLAVPYQEVGVDRQHAGDVIEKARKSSSQWPSPGCSSVGSRPVERCRPGTVESMRWRTP